MGSVLPSFKKEFAKRVDELAEAGPVYFFEKRNELKRDKKWRDLLIKGWKYGNNFPESDLMKIFKKIDPAYEFTTSNVYSRYGFFDTKSKMFLERDRNTFVTHTRTMIVFPDVFKVSDDALFYWLHERFLNELPSNKDRFADPMENPNVIQLLQAFEKTTNVANRLKFLNNKYISATDWNDGIIKSGLEDGRWVRVHSTAAQGKRWAINIFEKNVNPDVIDEIGGYSTDYV